MADDDAAANPRSYERHVQRQASTCLGWHPESVSVYSVKGGLTNLLFRCSIHHENSSTSLNSPESQAVSSSSDDGPADPKTLSNCLYRLYGLGGGTVARITEESVAQLLGKLKIAPQVFGIDPDGSGRFEELLPGRPLHCSHLSHPRIIQVVAPKLAALHQIELESDFPITRDPLADTVPLAYLSKLGKILHENKEKDTTGKSSMDKSELIASLQSQVMSILESAGFHVLHSTYVTSSNDVSQLSTDNWLDALHEVVTKYLGEWKHVSSPVVFCHNDLQEGNILIVPDDVALQESYYRNLGQAVDSIPDEFSVSFIDFEYSGFNYRGIDIANHFLEHMIDNQWPEFPFYKFRTRAGGSPADRVCATDPDSWGIPNAADRRQFYEHYQNGASSINPCILDPDHLDVEVLIGIMGSHINWALWGLVHHCMGPSDIQFGYLEYALERLQHFCHLLHRWLASGRTFRLS